MSTASHHPHESCFRAGNGARPDRQPLPAITPVRRDLGGVDSLDAEGDPGTTRRMALRLTDRASPPAEVLVTVPMLRALASSPAAAGSNPCPGAEGRMPPWKTEERQQIRWVFRHKKAWEIYNFHLGEGTWMAGGCWVAAEAIRRAYGGSLVALCSPHGPEHIAVESRGYCIDSRGSALRTEKFASKYAASERIKIVDTTTCFASKAEERGIPYTEAAVHELTPALLGRWGSPRGCLRQ